MSEKTFLYVMTCVDEHMLEVLHMLVNYRNCQISVNFSKIPLETFSAILLDLCKLVGAVI